MAPPARRLRRSRPCRAWISSAGTQPALELLNRLGIASVYEHDVALANRFRAGLGLPRSDSAIVTVDHPQAGGRRGRAGISAAERGGELRVSCHVPNTAADIEAALDALSG